jgi:hypothetical protein
VLPAPEPEVCGRGQRKRARLSSDEEKRERAKKLRIALVLIGDASNAPTAEPLRTPVFARSAPRRAANGLAMLWFLACTSNSM